MDDSVLRIGEVAHLAGVSTRTIRHYHHAGVLPEPPRMQNGYRRYGIRDVVLLLRVRRLVELGMSLDEVKDALAEPAGSDLRESLAAHVDRPAVAARANLPDDPTSSPHAPRLRSGHGPETARRRGPCGTRRR